MDVRNVINDLILLGDETNREGMSRFGINVETALGVRIPELRKYAKNHKNNHALALELWKTGIHDARLLASMIDDQEKVTKRQMESWVKDFNSWDVCDQVCSNLFDRTEFAFDKALEWSERKREFEKRAGFVLMATLAVHDKEADNKKFVPFFAAIEKHAYDERNFVKKAVNWALRQIGKRNSTLHQKAEQTAEGIKKQNTKSAKWIASDALRELNSEKILRTLKKNL